MTVDLDAPVVRLWQGLLGVARSGYKPTLNPFTMARLDDWLDRRTHPRWRLTPLEKKVMRACRLRFGYYDPTERAQISYIAYLTGKRATAPRIYRPVVAA